MTDKPLDTQELPPLVKMMIQPPGRGYGIPETDAYIASLKRDLREALSRLSQLEKENQWISVEDSLPNEEGDYLTALSDEEIVMCYFISGQWDAEGVRGSSEQFDITHWRLLPSPPKEAL